jgi:hypothetical protein
MDDLELGKAMLTEAEERLDFIRKVHSQCRHDRSERSSAIHQSRPVNVGSRISHSLLKEKVKPIHNPPPYYSNATTTIIQRPPMQHCHHSPRRFITSHRI